MSEAIAPQRWKQLRPLLDRALDLEEGERAAFLAQLSQQSAELREDLERILRWQQQTSPIDLPAAAMAATALVEPPEPHVDRNLGRRIGAFRLTEVLGSGGMGSVYAADRVEGSFQQRVAIKLISGIHPGLAERFAQERQILADLRHPNIAQLIDGGETDDGLPYFTMELLEGLDIAQWVTRHQCELNERVRLLIEVGQALAYAHRRGVIHRDIKPGNVVVTHEGHVKLVDFGIARLVDPALDKSMTQAGPGPMTPEFAAPEQFVGGEVSVATDIYQMGVLIFRLVSGQQPYRASVENLHGWAQAVLGDQTIDLVKKMRQNTASSTLRTYPGPVNPAQLRRLNAICVQAMAKDPAQRFVSMDELVAQLQACRQSPGMPRALGARSHWGVAIALAASLGLAGAGWMLLPRATTDAATSPEQAWQNEPALVAMGLAQENLHLQHSASDALIQRALLAEARGDLPAALALLETVHQSDQQTPIPAMLITYWGRSRLDPGSEQRWLAQRSARLGAAADPYLDLLTRFLETDVTGQTSEALRYSQALLELRPKAWYLHLARAHLLNAMGSRPAALRELQQIQVQRLGHRKLVDALADRASLGDLAGARAAYQSLAPDPSDPQQAILGARLAFTAGDLRQSRDRFVQAAELARATASYGAEARAWLWAGLFSGCLDEPEIAVEQLRLARVRLSEVGQSNYAFEVSLALAQLHALAGDHAALAEEISLADAADLDNPLSAAYRQLFAARLVNRPVAIDESPPSMLQAPGDYVHQLLQARAALQRQDPATATSALAKALDEGVGDSLLAEEAGLLARELGMTEPPLTPIDPPFGPYPRFAARWALGAGGSVTPPPPED